MGEKVDRLVKLAEIPIPRHKRIVRGKVQDVDAHMRKIQARAFVVGPMVTDPDLRKVYEEAGEAFRAGRFDLADRQLKQVEKAMGVDRGALKPDSDYMRRVAEKEDRLVVENEEDRLAVERGKALAAGLKSLGELESNRMRMEADKPTSPLRGVRDTMGSKDRQDRSVASTLDELRSAGGKGAPGSRLEEFGAVYLEELKKESETNPEVYSPASIEGTHGRMMKAVAMGSFNKDSAPMKRTFKRLGIPHTYKGLNEYLGRRQRFIGDRESEPSARMVADKPTSQRLRELNDGPRVSSSKAALKNVEKLKQGRLQIRSKTYRGREGFTVVGTDPKGRRVSVFAETREQADKAKKNIMEGRSAFSDNVPSDPELGTKIRERDEYEASLTKSGHRPLSTIASEIRRDWGDKVNFGAKPYLDALGSLNDVKDNYGADPGDQIVMYFLSNATSWRGENARRIKAELKAILKKAR